MAQIDINSTYKNYLINQVKAGVFSSITEAAEYAIHEQMIEYQKSNINSIKEIIAKGEADIKKGNVIKYTPNLMEDISNKGKQDSQSGKPVKDVVKP